MLSQEEGEEGERTPLLQEKHVIFMRQKEGKERTDVVVGHTRQSYDEWN